VNGGDTVPIVSVTAPAYKNVKLFNNIIYGKGSELTALKVSNLNEFTSNNNLFYLPDRNDQIFNLGGSSGNLAWWR